MRKIFLVLLLGLTVLATVSALVEAVTMSKTTESGQTAEDLAKGLTADEEEEETVPSLLLESILNSDYDSIQAALESGEDINTANMNGWSATMMAVFAGDLSVISFLIDNGADINLGNIDGVTPLMLATAMVSKQLV